MLLAGLAALAALLACSKSNPVAPPAPTVSGGGSATGSYTITLSLVPRQLAAGASGTLSVDVKRSSDLKPPASGSTVSLNTEVGYFSLNSAGKPVQSATVTLSGGAGQTAFFAGDTVASGDVLALFEDSTANLSISVVEPETPPFYVSLVQPDVGSGQGGEAVKILGKGFTEPLRVTFGDAPAQIVDGSVKDTSVMVKTPPPVPVLTSGESRRVDVAVSIDLDGTPRTDTLKGGFIYTQGGGPLNQPAIFSVDPTSGPNAGGTQVTISGQGFESNARVFFGFAQGDGFDGVAVPAKDVVSRDAEGASITVLSPAASGAGQALLNQTVDVQVQNPRTGLAAVATAAFRYGAGSGGGGLQVTDVSPRQAAYTGLDDSGSPVSMTVLGQGFGAAGNGDLRALLAGVDQGTPTVVSDTELTFDLAAATVSKCAPPSGPAVITNVVTAESGIGSLDFAYTVNAPLLATLSPASSAESGGGTVTVNGSDLLGTGATSETVEVTIDGVRATVTSVSATAVAVTVPAFTGTFASEECDDNGDGTPGTRSLPTAVDVAFTNKASGCSDSLPRSFTYEPADATCQETAATPLEADFTFIVSGMTVTFNNTSTGQPTSFFWDFGDGTTGIETTQENPIHTYAAADTYTVALYVEDAAGQQSSASRMVVVP